MKLRRAMAVAATTAVTAPPALLPAPAAFATGGEEKPSTSTSTPAEGGNLPADDGNPPADDSLPADDEILAAGSAPGKPNDAEPRTGGEVALAEVKDVEVAGSLAGTGSSSAPPVTGLAGGAAVTAGAGAVSVARRRRAGSGA